MKVRMLVSIAGHAVPDYEMPEFSFVPGDVLELHDEIAGKWVASGLAESVAVEPEVKKPKRTKEQESE